MTPPSLVPETGRAVHQIRSRFRVALGDGSREETPGAVEVD